jgi:flagellar hook assembly protein FlgD
VQVGIHDVAGRIVRTIDAGVRPAGAHELTWDGRDDAGVPVAPGVYLARLAAGGAAAVTRVVMLR